MLKLVRKGMVDQSTAGYSMTMRRARFVLAFCLSAPALRAQVAPTPAPAPPAGPLVIIADHALDGRGGVMSNVRIGVAQGKITSLAAPQSSGATTIDLRGY